MSPLDWLQGVLCLVPTLVVRHTEVALRHILVVHPVGVELGHTQTCPACSLPCHALLCRLPPCPYLGWDGMAPVRLPLILGMGESLLVLEGMLAPPLPLALPPTPFGWQRGVDMVEWQCWPPGLGVGARMRAAYTALEVVL